MRRSQYFDAYLDTAAECRYTPGTFLAYELRGKAKEYSARYQRALERALKDAVARGEVVEVRSVGGSTAYVRISDLRAEDDRQ